MDNDTIEMTCEQVEDELSGYLDNVLDLPLRRNVEAHLTFCDQCQTILDDYRRGDEMLRAMPFIEPPADMRDRFFNSPRYLKLAHARAQPRNFITPLKVALVAAAMLVVVLGGALMFRQGFFASQQANKHGTTTTIGNPGNGAPLPAGPRLIYERGGALWSAPESGAGLPQQLTPSGIQVAGWSVSPNGRAVLYIDAHRGALHTIRADAQNDAVIGSVTGGKAPAADFWTTPTGAAIADGLAWSPDNTRVAYLAQSDGAVALRVMNATGAADTLAHLVANGEIGQPLWSADSVYIAYTVNRSGAQSVWAYNVTTGIDLTMAAHTDASDAAAVAAGLAWLPNHAPATITWAARDGGTVTGVYRADATSGLSAVQITPASGSYAVAALSSEGVWLLANGPTLSTLAANQTGPHVVATMAHPVTQARWAPSGQVAAVLTDDGALALLTPGRAVVPVARGLAAQSAFVWSPDSAALAWQSGDGVMSAQVRQGAASGAKLVAAHAGVTAIAWAPDGQSLALRSTTGMLLVTADGAQVRATDGQAASAGQFAWSLAG